jgi:hypothetical protein
MDNLFIKLLDRRGRILWINNQIDRSLWDKPYVEYAVEEDRKLVEESFTRCVVFGETVEFAARWYCPISNTNGWWLTQIQAVESGMGDLAAILVQTQLPENFTEFNEADRELLSLLADDHNIKDAATTVDRSESAIDARIRGLKTKTGKNTLHGLVAAAVRGRLVPMVTPEFISIYCDRMVSATGRQAPLPE